MEEVIKLIHNIWLTDEKLITGAVDEIKEINYDPKRKEKMGKVIFDLMKKRKEAAEHSYLQLKSFLIEGGYDFEEEPDLAWLSYDDLLNKGIGYASDKLGLEKVYIKYIIDVSTKVTKKLPGEIIVKDVVTMPKRYFSEHPGSNKIIIDRVDRFLGKLWEELKKKKEVAM